MGGARGAVAAAGGGADSRRRTLCFFGHAIYSGAIAHLLATQRGLPAASLDAIAAYNMQEACGFWVGESEARLLVHDLADLATNAAADSVADSATKRMSSHESPS